MQHQWVSDGRPIGRIVIAKTAREHERFAADELARYLEQMSDVRLPVVEGLRDHESPAIVIADVSRPSVARCFTDLPLASLQDDGFMIQSRGDDLVIASLDPFGVVFGTYQFLKRILGVRFADLDPAGEDVPRCATIAHDAQQLVINPKLRYRGTQMAYHPSRLDWMAKNGFNYSRVGSANKPLSYFDDVLDRMKPDLRKRGIRLNFGHHSFQMFLPSEHYFTEAPDYYIQKDGQPKQQAQFCWSLQCPEVMDEVIHNITHFLRRHPEIVMLDFWPSDGVYELDDNDFRAVTGGEEPEHGEWEKHVAGKTITARLGDLNKAKVYALLTQKVAEALAPRFPYLTITVTPYADLTQPHTDVPVPSNVVPFIAIYWRCRTHNLLDHECVFNGQYRQILAEWADHVPDRQIYVSEYYAAVNAYCQLPYPCLTRMFEEWPGLIDLGVRGAKAHTGRDADHHGAIYNINYLAFAAIAWGEHATLDSFLTDYCNSYFGNAGNAMRQFFLRLEQAVQEAEHTQPAVVSMGSPPLDHLFTNQVLDDCDARLDEAQQKADAPKPLYRIARWRIIMAYMRKAMALATPWHDRTRLKLAGESTEQIDRAIIDDVRAIVDTLRQMIELDVDVFGYVGSSPYFDRDDQPAKRRNRWETLLGEITSQPWVADLFNEDVLQKR